MELSFRAKLWLWDGKGAWHFMSLPVEIYNDIKLLSSGRSGFGSIRVQATIGSTSWDTSIFPDTTRKTYLLPVKKAVRHTEKLVTDESYSCHIVLSTA